MTAAKRGDISKGRRGLAFQALLVGGALAAAGPTGAETAPQVGGRPGVIGLALSDMKYAIHETPGGKQECPDGFQHDLSANYKAEYPTPEARKAREQSVGYYTNRGPAGENVYYHPTVVKDSLPFRDAKGPTAIGLDLDGESDGKGAGGYSLPHENFVSPEGVRGVDNQLYRVLGCTGGWRKGGISVGVASTYVRSDSYMRVLIEVSGVDSEVNDDNVTLTLYRGLDPVAVDSKEQPVPWLSQRIDYKYGRRYVARLSGKIVDGVLISEPTDVRLPHMDRPGIYGDRLIRKMRLQLKLNPTGASGLMGGYADIENFYLMYTKIWGGHKVADVVGWSGPAVYNALHRFADYKDPATGETTGISAAFQMEFARGFIVHTAQGEALLAQSGLPTTPVTAPIEAKTVASR